MDFILALFVIIGIASATFNDTQMYKLKTQLKPNSAGKTNFGDLYLVSYHTGAGLGDATFLPGCSNGISGFLNSTAPFDNSTTAPYVTQLFDLGNGIPWHMIIEQNTVFYTGWQPVAINGGGVNVGPDTESLTSVSGFFINETGLQWTTSPERPGWEGDGFGGWLVCNWWHNVPQLFFRVKGYNAQSPTIETCADVLLVPEYI